jgi:hypothetical protein
MRSLIRPLSLSLLIALVSLGGCITVAPLSQTAYEQATSSQTAYEQATSIKAEALVLMDKAATPYAEHQQEVSALLLRTEKAYEYAKGRPKNESSTRQWEIIKDPSHDLLGGFMKRWSQSSTLTPAFIGEAKAIVADAFDTVIGIESGKVKPTDVQR